MALGPSCTPTPELEPGNAVEEARRYTIGPMPVHDFLSEFLACGDSRDPKAMMSSRRAFESVPARAETSMAIYQPLVSL